MNHCHDLVDLHKVYFCWADIFHSCNLQCTCLTSSDTHARINRPMRTEFDWQLRLQRLRATVLYRNTKSTHNLVCSSVVAYYSFQHVFATNVLVEKTSVNILFSTKSTPKIENLCSQFFRYLVCIVCRCTFMFFLLFCFTVLGKLSCLLVY